jgi:hypothetical protein
MHLPIWLILLAIVLFCWRHGRNPRAAILWAAALGVYLASTAFGDIIRSVGTAAATFGG